MQIPLPTRLVALPTVRWGALRLLLTGLLVWLALLVWYVQPRPLWLPGAQLAPYVVPAGQASNAVQHELRHGSLVLTNDSPQPARLLLALPDQSTGPVLLLLRARVPGPLAPQPLDVAMQGSPPVTIPVDDTPRTYRLLLPAGAPPGQPDQLMLTLPPAQGELPQVLALSGLTYAPHGGQLPTVPDALLLLGGLALGALLWVRLGLLASVGLGLSAAMLLPALPHLHTTPLVWLLGGLLLAHAALALWQAVQPAAAHWRGLALAGALLLLGGLALAGPGALLLSAQLAGIAGVLLATLCYCGFGLTWLLRSRRLAPMLPLYTPVIGLAGLIGVGHALGYLPVGTDTTLVPIVALFTVLNVLAWWQGARPRFRQQHMLAASAGLLAFGLGVLPLYVAGYLTTTGGSIDALFYVVRSEFRQVSGLLTLPPLTLDVPPFLPTMRPLMQLREGDTFLLAFFSSLLGLRPHLIFPVLLALWFAFTSVGVFVLARSELRLPPLVAWAAALLVAVQSLIQTPVTNNVLSQAGGIALWCFVLVALLAAMRHGTWRTVLLAGLLVVTLATIYPPYLVYMAPIAGLLCLVELLRRAGITLERLPTWADLGLLWRHGLVLARRGVGVVAVALLSMPLAWMLFWHHTQLTNNAFGRDYDRARGDIRVFPHLGELFGYVNHAAAVYPRQYGTLPQPSYALASGLLLACGALLLYGLVASRWRQRWPLLFMLLVYSTAMAHMGLWVTQGSGDAYLYNKIISAFCPLAVLLLVASAYRLWQQAGPLARPLRDTLRGGALALVGGIGAVALFHSAATAVLVGQGRGIVLQDTQLAMAQAVNRHLPADEPLLLIDKTNPGQVWSGYLLQRPNMYYRQPMRTYWVRTAAYSPQRIDYALIALPDLAWNWEALPGEPWFDAQTRQVLWRNEDYMLVRRTDAPAAELLLAHGNLPRGFGLPLTVELAADTLRVTSAHTPRQPFVQTLDQPAATLQMTVQGTAGDTLTLTDTQTDTAHEIILTGAPQTLTLPASAADVRLSAPGSAASDEPVRVLGLVAYPAGTPPNQAGNYLVE